ncbi:MAG: ATP-binding protein [Betaproteobacteria bacterium]
MTDKDWGALLARAERVLAQLEAWLPPAPAPVAWERATAFRWRKRVHGRDGGGGHLEAVRNVHKITLADLQGIDRQKKLVEQNTRQLIAGAPANNVLMTGSRGTGKSSLVKALLHKYAKQGLRVIEVDKDDLIDLLDIVDMIVDRPEKFIIFCDDLSFDAGEAGYKALKVILDGTVAATSTNMLIYATSNRRHLLPEYFSENLETRHVGEEVHPGESVEEKVSLSERFGLWVSFYPFTQDEYFAAVRGWLKHYGFAADAFDTLREEAVQWALSRGSRSGRIAWQFARDQAGKRATLR